jgi:myo-inositol-1(or 4)-monophosphatase
MLEHESAIALGLADRAAAIAMGLFRGDGLEVRLKADLSMVTQADTSIEAMMREQLAVAFPDDRVLGEEEGGSVEGDGRVWIVDPIDGTKQLVRGIPEVAISIGLSVSGRVAAAAIVNPMTGERGSWVDGEPPVFEGLAARSVPESLDLAEAIVSRTETEAGDLAGLGTLVGSTRPVGSVAYKLLRVAAGADALTFSLRPKSEWDICGGAGLIAASGRVYLRLDGAPNAFNRPDPVIRSGAVAGPSALAEALRRALVARLGGPVRSR